MQVEFVESNQVLVKQIIDTNFVGLRIPVKMEELGHVGRHILKYSTYNQHAASVRKGQCFETVYRELAKLTFTSSGVPSFIAGFGVTDEEAIIYTESHKN